MDFKWTLAVALAAVAATAASEAASPSVRAAAQALAGSAAGVRDGQAWRLLTGSLVHATQGHLWRDVAALLGLGFVYESQMRRRWPWLLAAGLVVPSLVVVACEKDVRSFFGLSGATYALIAGALVFETFRGGRPPRVLVVLAILAAGKLVFEAATGTLLLPMDLGEGRHVAPLAHLAGAVTGAALAWPGFRGRKRRTSLRARG